MDDLPYICDVIIQTISIEIMKSKIMEALRLKFEGVSDLYLEGVASSLAKKVKTEDAIGGAIEGVTLDKLFEHYGDTRATNAYNRAEEKARRLREEQERNQPEENDPDGDDKGGEPLTTKTIERLIQEAVKQSTEEIQKRLNQATEESLKRERKEAIDKVLQTCKNETIREMKARDFGRLTFADAEAFDSYLKELTRDVEAINKQTAQSDLLNMHQPLLGGGGNQTGVELGADAIQSIVSEIYR